MSDQQSKSGYAVRCNGCGAMYDADYSYCPYCGRMNDPAAEREYMEHLEELRQDVEELSVIPGQEAAKDLERALCGFNTMMATAYEEIAPHRVCAYVYDLANALNHFYHETKILTEAEEEKKASYIALLSLTLRVMETCIDLLGFEAPERM